MKMAKASEADLSMAMDLCNALDALTSRWAATVPDAIAKPDGNDESEFFDRDNPEHCQRVLGYLLDLVNRGSLMRVVWGAAVMLDPANKCVDPDADAIEHHPDTLAALSAKEARPLSEYHEDKGNVLWWKFPIDEPPYCGQPSDNDWPGYHTHWTPLLVPDAPIEGGEA